MISVLEGIQKWTVTVTESVSWKLRRKDRVIKVDSSHEEVCTWRHRETYAWRARGSSSPAGTEGVRYKVGYHKGMRRTSQVNAFKDGSSQLKNGHWVFMCKHNGRTWKDLDLLRWLLYKLLKCAADRRNNYYCQSAQLASSSSLLQLCLSIFGFCHLSL